MLTFYIAVVDLQLKVEVSETVRRTLSPYSPLQLARRQVSHLGTFRPKYAVYACRDGPGLDLRVQRLGGIRVLAFRAETLKAVAGTSSTVAAN